MTREEAIEVYHGLLNQKIKEAFEVFAPELKESEDEIHKKWILEYLYEGLRESDEQFKEQFKSAIDWLEKQKEQKPTEWSEEDEEMYARVVRRYTDYGWVITRTKEESVANKMLDAMVQEETWLESLPERFNLQPKQEWSEEEKRR